MNLDFDKHERSGRTTRMLEYAIKSARRLQTAVVIIARNQAHMHDLKFKMTEMVPDKEEMDAIRGKITLVSIEDVIHRNIIRPGLCRTYDYATNRFLRDTYLTAPNCEVLIDHFALEAHLANVILYLRTASNVADSTQWLIDTARMLSMMGRKVYVVSDDEETQQRFKLAQLHPSISVEDGQHMGNLDLLNQHLVDVHPNVQLLLDPKMLERHFCGALNEINRWNP